MLGSLLEMIGDYPTDKNLALKLEEDDINTLCLYISTEIKISPIAGLI